MRVFRLELFLSNKSFSLSELLSNFEETSEKIERQDKDVLQRGLFYFVRFSTFKLAGFQKERKDAFVQRGVHWTVVHVFDLLLWIVIRFIEREE